MILFVNACVRKNSRTRRISRCLLDKLQGEVCEIRLADFEFPVVNEEFLRKRDSLVKKGNLTDPMFYLAKQFSEAEIIVIAAPFWDLSFPAALKQYLEQITVAGITFRYTEDGIPEGLCRADKLYYVTTAGGDFLPESYGYGYVKALAQNFYGIPDVELIKVTGLDIIGCPVEEKLQECEEKIRENSTLT